MRRLSALKSHIGQLQRRPLYIFNYHGFYSLNALLAFELNFCLKRQDDAALLERASSCGAKPSYVVSWDSFEFWPNPLVFPLNIVIFYHVRLTFYRNLGIVSQELNENRLCTKELAVSFVAITAWVTYANRFRCTCRSCNNDMCIHNHA